MKNNGNFNQNVEDEDHQSLATSCSASSSLSSRSTSSQAVYSRAQHKISVGAIRHNYSYIESIAASQKCSVIAVVKADAYGHGVELTAKHLVKRCSANAFAVATLEEAIKIRKVFPLDGGNNAYPFIRIMVLGPPLNYPRCFDSYFHYGIEVMVSSEEVAGSLEEWAKDVESRRLKQVESAALERKEKLLDAAGAVEDEVAFGKTIVKPLRSALMRKKTVENEELVEISDVSSKKSEEAVSYLNPLESAFQRPSLASGNCTSKTSDDEEQSISSNLPTNLQPTSHVPTAFSATLSQTSGHHLAAEVRNILLTQAEYQKQATNHAVSSAVSSRRHSPSLEESQPISSSINNGINSGPAVLQTPTNTVAQSIPMSGPVASSTTRFRGIEDVSRMSRNYANIKVQESNAQGVQVNKQQLMQAQRRKLRWHALVDSGMGRLGFKEIDGSYASALQSIKSTTALEMDKDSPIEFFGMCTHMAEAIEGSEYTQAQMDKFVSLLNQVRKEGISIPTISTDNSSALLTTSLKHFSPEILSQANVDTRGYVRCGGAIYGQRAAFKELRAVSTLSARVRHVAIMNPGDSVGYDRAYVAMQKTRIATISIGFADGYPRELGNGIGKVSIRGEIYPVAGNVCMDMLMVDLGLEDDTHSVGSIVEVGDEAILWGPDESNEKDGLVRLCDIASTLKTTQSALTCGLNIERVDRKLVR